jgi:hypothetical protein
VHSLGNLPKWASGENIRWDGGVQCEKGVWKIAGGEPETAVEINGSEEVGRRECSKVGIFGT